MMQKIKKSDLAVFNEKCLSNLKKKNTDFNVKKYSEQKSGTPENKAPH